MITSRGNNLIIIIAETTVICTCVYTILNIFGLMHAVCLWLCVHPFVENLFFISYKLSHECNLNQSAVCGLVLPCKSSCKLNTNPCVYELSHHLFKTLFHYLRRRLSEILCKCFNDVNCFLQYTMNVNELCHSKDVLQTYVFCVQNNIFIVYFRQESLPHKHQYWKYEWI